MAGDKTVTITDDNFDQEVLQSDKPVLLDFWAEWCGPCKALTPVIDDLAKEFDGKVKVGKVDTDANREISVRFSISAIPTVIVFKDGDIVEKFVGLRGKKDYANTLNKLVGAS